jgi:hypothetical protein
LPAFAPTGAAEKTLIKIIYESGTWPADFLPVVAAFFLSIENDIEYIYLRYIGNILRF